ncbi:MAG TPA: hypothetical protein VMH24_09290 [Candidatus Sulfotelmatobacter sp.]|nr:hypothetical protein [Candidatus Sulfotelmatobacter sp.]
MGRILAAVALLIVLVAGGGLIAADAYQAGLTAATASGSGQVVAVPAYAFGWHAFGLGFGFLGFLGTLLFLFLIFALLRVVLFGGRHRGWGHGRYGDWPRRWDTPNTPDQAGARPSSPWEARVHSTFEDWHRAAHGTGPQDPPPPAAPPAPPAA